MDNEVKMYFNGLLTEQQLITIIISLVAIIIVLSLAKKVIKLVLTVVIVIGALLYFNIISPEQLSDVEKVITEKGTQLLEEMAKASENIEISYKDKDVILKIRPDNCDNYINIKEFEKIIQKDEGTTLVDKEGNSFLTTDKNVIKLLELFKK